jgi:hypothetical protein
MPFEWSVVELLAIWNFFLFLTIQLIGTPQPPLIFDSLDKRHYPRKHQQTLNTVHVLGGDF